MANDKLRVALRSAGLAPDDLAQIVEVDVRTVRRWLSGRTPYPRQRGKVARALDATEHELWPEIAAAPPSPQARASDMLAAYPAASDLGAPDWKLLMREVTNQVELLSDTLIPILATPGVPELLAAKASYGCAVRILVSEPGPHLAPFVEKAGIEIRVLEVPAPYTIQRFDDQLLLTIHMLGQDAEQAPLLHLRRAASGGLFDRFAQHYNDLWEQDSQPIKPGLDLADDDEDEEDEEDEEDIENPESDPRVLAPDQPAAGGDGPSAPRPRRWPGRRT